MTCRSGAYAPAAECRFARTRQRIEERAEGVQVTRSDAARILLGKALDAEGL